MKFGDITLPEGRPFLILEAGVNHEGSRDRAFEMIDAAAASGADAIKFQSYKAETLASKDSPAYWDRREEKADSQYGLFKRYDGFGDEEYLALAKRCAEKNILFSSTPFDCHFVDVLDPLMPFFKIASADLTNVLLLRKIAQKKKPIILSTGASYLSEVEEAVRFLAEEGVTEIALLHCVLEYPTDPANANLNAIPYLGQVFPQCVIGYSDHVPPINNCQALSLAWLKGARILEKHFTLDKTQPGNDHYHAMDPDDVRDFLDRQRRAAEMLGKPGKTCLPCEFSARLNARRSIVAAVDINEGEEIKRGALTSKRPGIGISPLRSGEIVGRRARRFIKMDDRIGWEDLE